MRRVTLAPALAVVLAGCSSSSPSPQVTAPPSSTPAPTSVPSSPEAVASPQPPSTATVTDAYRVAIAPLADIEIGSPAATIEAVTFPVEVAPGSLAEQEWESAIARATGDDPVLVRTTVHDIAVLDDPTLSTVGAATTTLCVASTMSAVRPDTGTPVGTTEEGVGETAPYRREVVELELVDGTWAVASTTSLRRVVTDAMVASGDSGLGPDDQCIPPDDLTAITSQWERFTEAYASVLATLSQGPGPARDAEAFTDVDTAAELFGTPLDVPDGLVRIETTGTDRDLTLLEARWPDEADVVWCRDPSLNPEAGLHYADGTFGPATDPSVARARFVEVDGTWRLADFETFTDTSEDAARPRYPEGHPCF